jgi:hypothetical protein
MLPLTADKLSFREIAKFWSREIHPHASRDELVDTLEAAWWRGEVVGTAATTRLQLLRSMFAQRASPSFEGIVFVTPDDAGRSAVTERANGEVWVDVAPRITVPRETDQWTEESCAGAFEALAKSPSREHFPALSVSLHFIELTREEFFRWVKRRGFYVPTFWRDQAAPESLNDGTGNKKPKLTSKPPLKKDLEEAYKQRIKDFDFSGKIPPSRRDDEEWGKERGLTRTKVRELRREHAPLQWKSLGRRKSKGSK